MGHESQRKGPRRRESPQATPPARRADSRTEGATKRATATAAGRGPDRAEAHGASRPEPFPRDKKPPKNATPLPFCPFFPKKPRLDTISTYFPSALSHASNSYTLTGLFRCATVYVCTNRYGIFSE